MIDDAFASTFITDSMVTCLDCSFMQEIAEYPLMLMGLMVYHYRLCGDRAYLASHYDDAVRLLEVYRRDYEQDGLLQNLDKWCVVEWTQNFRDGYDVDLREGGTTTFEGWGKDTRWNTSLFHLTMCDAVLFLADVDRVRLYGYDDPAENGQNM